MKNFICTLLFALLLITTNAFAQVPVYNSYPSASAVILLDFDGHNVNGTMWNTNGAIDCASANMTTDQITEAYNRIAEDYRPFNVNVTTDETKYNAAPTTKRMRVIFTTSSSWYGNGAGGVAYISSFTWGDNTPCFVFTALLNYNVKQISEAGAHEAGHTLGLQHQASYDANCNRTSSYHYGNGDGEIGWAPIMGVGYYKNFTVWHNGSDPWGCNNTQSDLSIIAGATNGFGYRTDDHTNVSSTATTATFTSNQFNLSGVISKTDDVDLFKFTLSTNRRFQLNAIPYNVGTGNTGSDLDMQVDLLNASQVVIGTYNPGNALNSIIDSVMNAGTYYLRIDGNGNQYASEYGSLGSYSLQGIALPISVLPLRKLELKGASEGSAHKFNWVIDADEQVVRQVLEVSSNGRQFELATQPTALVRDYQYIPTSSAAFQYRLAVTFDNGKQHYSNVIALKTGKSVKPELYTNLVRSNSIMVNSPATYSYAITDFSGRIVAKGNINQGASTININNITNGSYIIRFANEANAYVDKFVKQ